MQTGNQWLKEKIKKVEQRQIVAHQVLEKKNIAKQEALKKKNHPQKTLIQPLLKTLLTLIR